MLDTLHDFNLCCQVGPRIMAHLDELQIEQPEEVCIVSDQHDHVIGDETKKN